MNQSLISLTPEPGATPQSSTPLSLSVRVVSWHTGHMHHAAVAVLHQVACLTVNATCTEAVSAEEVGVRRIHLAVPPWRRQKHQLRNTDAD